MLFSFWTSKNPGKALEKTVKQPWKTLDFWISEDVRTLKLFLLLFCNLNAHSLVFFYLQDFTLLFHIF